MPNYKSKINGDIAEYDSTMGLWYVDGIGYPIPIGKWEFKDNDEWEEIADFSLEVLDVYYKSIRKMANQPSIGVGYILSDRNGSDIAEITYSSLMGLYVIVDNFPSQRKIYKTSFPINCTHDLEAEMKRIKIKLK